MSKSVSRLAATGLLMLFTPVGSVLQGQAPGPGPDMTIYILTSNRTFSAAEDFTYGLKNQKRATIVGEVTGGGAHPVGPRRINDHFLVVVPMGRSISSITHTDWEGVGVEPDVQVPAAQALATAHVMALEKRLSVVTEPPMKAEITAAVERLKKELVRQKTEANQ